MTITNSAISRIEISETLAKIRAFSNPAKSAGALNDAKPAQFTQILDIAKHTVADINHAQLQTESIKQAYLTGDPKVSVSQVMMSTMNSKLAFEGLLVVRNKLLDAYKEIMNMPV